MAIHVRQNLFAGVNPYLQSFLQTPGTHEEPSFWRSFHGQFIVILNQRINEHLPSGYRAMNERSLQIWGEADGGVQRQMRIPDVSVYQRLSVSQPPTMQNLTVLPTWEVAIETTFDEAQLFGDAVLIYQNVESKILGRLVTRIELLSPSNKEGGEHSGNYRKSREEVLKSLIPLLEIDFLHESIPPIYNIPLYPYSQDSSPYNILVNDPRPNVKLGKTRGFGAKVHQSLSEIPIPLADEDVLLFNFDAVYQETYENNFWGDFVDYEDLPPRLESYHPDDQQRIHARRAEILSQQKNP